jgi:hypothetical protein
MTTDSATPKNISTGFNRWLYGAFVALCIYNLIRGNAGDAASNLGIAMIFDPFAPANWGERKKWQKVWLFVHVALVIGLFAVWFIRR